MPALQRLCIHRYAYLRSEVQRGLLTGVVHHLFQPGTRTARTRNGPLPADDCRADVAGRAALNPSVIPFRSRLTVHRETALLDNEPWYSSQPLTPPKSTLLQSSDRLLFACRSQGSLFLPRSTFRAARERCPAGHLLLPGLYVEGMDSIIPLVAGALGGAVVTTLVGTITFILTGRREHRRWLYDLKYQNYLEVLRIWNHWTRLSKPGMSPEDYAKQEPIYLKISELVLADLVLVNSPRVDRAFSRLLQAMHNQFEKMKTGERSAYDLRAEWLLLVREMRRDLNIKGIVKSGVQ
jgi:hypothetical protein